MAKQLAGSDGPALVKLRPRKWSPRLWQILCVFSLAQIANAHQQPTTLAVLNIDSQRVELKLHVPLSELELAFGHHVTERPQETMPLWTEPLRQYLIEHIRPVG